MRRSTLRLYSRKASAMDKWKPLRIDNFLNGKLKIDNGQFIWHGLHIIRHGFHGLHGIIILR